MAITYPLDFPTDLGLNDFTLRAVNAVARTESPFTFQEQVYDWGGQKWELEAKIPVTTRATAEIYASFLIKLKGKKGTFTITIPNSETPQGTGNGTPVVDGGSQTGSTLDVRGFDPSETVLKAGDYIQLGSGATTSLHKVLNDATSDGSGDVTLDIFPDLRSSPSDGATVVISNPKGLFRLAENQTDIKINEPYFYNLSFKAVESI